MSSDPTLPPYPPARVWSFPPPPVRRRWFWVALAASILATALAVGLVVVAVAVGRDDAPGLIQDARVLDTIDTECKSMTDVVESYPLGSSRDDLAGAIRDQNDAVTTMVGRIADLPDDVLRGDEPTLAWLADWRALVDARDSYAERLERDGDDDFDVPRDDEGVTIDVRMQGALLDDVCPVPEVLLDPRGAGASAI